MAGEHKTVRISLYIPDELASALDAWRVKHAPLEPKTKAIERIIRDRIEADAPRK